MRLVIVDNSGEKHGGPECTKALKDYASNHENTDLYILEKNLGHGLGMHYGMKQIRTKYVYMFESDVIMRQPNLIEDMLKYMSDRIYAVGPYKFPVTYSGGKQCDSGTSVKTMIRVWIYCCLMNVKQYFKFPPFCSDKGINAAPTRNAFAAIHDTGRSRELLIDFDVDKYVQHLDGGTRCRIGIPPLEDYKEWSHYLKSL
jgi:GT2 family glycosyltransferase